MALPLIFACSGGSDSSPQANSPPGSNPPPGNTSPQPTAQVGRFNAPIAAIIPVPNGNGDIYVAGSFTTYNDQPVRPVVRLRPNGTLNDSFKLTDPVTRPSSDTSYVTAIAAADDGSGDLYVSETTPLPSQSPPWTAAHVWKVNSAGALASGFTAGELVYTDHPLDTPGATVFAMAPVGDGSGRVYLGGVFDTYNQTRVQHLVRLNTNGTVDPAFVPNLGGTSLWNLLPAKDGSGDLYVINYGHTGGPPSSFGPGILGRLNPDGTVDPAFPGFGRIDNSPYTVTLVEDGSGDLFVTGDFARMSSDIFLAGFARLNPDGSLDEASPLLNPDGSTNPSSPWSELWFPHSLTKATDGTNDWFVATSGGTPEQPSPHLQRFKADGTRDPSFTTAHVSRSDMFVQCVSADCGGINLILPAPDNTGDIYVAGSFTTYNTVPVGHIVRINRDGTLE